MVVVVVVVAGVRMLESSYCNSESMGSGRRAIICLSVFDLMSSAAVRQLGGNISSGSSWSAVNGPFRQGLLITYMCAMTLEAQSPKITTQRGKAQILHYAASRHQFTIIDR